MTSDTSLPSDLLAPEPTPLEAEHVPELDRRGFLSAVESAITSVRAGKLQKVVLSRTIVSDLAGTSIGALFMAAARSLPHAFVAITRTDRFGLWMGASPERLLALRDGRLEVDAIAATLPIQNAPESAAHWGAKEREEQAIVTRAVMDLLAAAGVRDAQAHGPQVKLAGNVAHLHTRIFAHGVGPEALDLAKALHPTPAVGGHPRDIAIDLIGQLEPRPRSLYAGYWGPMNAHSAELFVNIRCMHVQGTKAYLHVGAGITADSDPQREGDEVEQKARLWLDLFDAQRHAG
ncbi:MAG: chorismate-binding protein [Flavobacteriales bacterium]|nr:chorismate-binding protein [Flavobacteriales bacterium]